MKTKLPFRVFTFFIVVLMFSIPFVTLAQRTDVQAAAEADATKDANKPLWFGTGCLLSGVAYLLKPYGYFLLIGGLGGYLYEPGPPASRLIGKSPEYIETYTAIYNRKRGEVQANYMGAGCLSGCIVIAVAGGGIGFGLGVAAVTQ